MRLRPITAIILVGFSCVEAFVVPADASRKPPRVKTIIPNLVAPKDTAREVPIQCSNKSQVYSSKFFPLEWVSLGMSGIYLSHFASLYTQLPGLFGQSGLLPVSDRIADLQDIWVLNLLPSPEVGLEVFAALGIVISALQLVFRQLRWGRTGILTFSVLWMLWHDLVLAGGRFMSYQMDLLLLDAAPLTVLAAVSSLVPETAIGASFGYRWLLSRLYIGAGAVKLLSCDASWRDLSAVHTHLQSQPLPNPIGAAAYLHMPDEVGRVASLLVLVVEMAAPFLFLAPSGRIRRLAFALNVILMIGIAFFGNFGPLQALLIVIGFSLLDDDHGAAPDFSQQYESSTEPMTNATAKLAQDGGIYIQVLSTINVAAIGMATWGSFWAFFNVGARCIETLQVDPLVYCLTVVGAAVACVPLLTTDGLLAAVLSFAIFAGSVSTMANGLGVALPFFNSFEFLNFGAKPYGLFATITGVGGRPVAAIEGSYSIDGPWNYIPLLYQVNDPSASLPLCFPHFPRLDWTLWFVPLGESGLWIARLFDGITANDPSVISLLDKNVFYRSFQSSEPPAIVRVVPRVYELTDARNTPWLVSDQVRHSSSSRVLATFRKGDLANLEGRKQDSPQSPWPATPLLRSLATHAQRPEYFIWGCLGTAEVLRRATDSEEST